MNTPGTPRLSRDDIAAARRMLLPFVRVTPVRELARNLYGKLENEQYSGCFAYRGALNLLLTRHVQGEPVVAASAGWFGVALAEAASYLTLNATIFVPAATERSARLRMRANEGVTVETIDGDLPEAEAAARRFAEEVGAQFAAFDATEVLAGYGTIGVELTDQIDRLDTVVVPAGLGLAPGLACWFDERVRLVTVAGLEASFDPTLDGDEAVTRISGIPPMEADWAAGDLLGKECLVDRVAALPYAAVQWGRYEQSDGERIALVIPNGRIG